MTFESFSISVKAKRTTNDSIGVPGMGDKILFGDDDERVWDGKNWVKPEELEAAIPERLSSIPFDDLKPNVMYGYIEYLSDETSLIESYGECVINRTGDDTIIAEFVGYDVLEGESTQFMINNWNSLAYQINGIVFRYLS